MSLCLLYLKPTSFDDTHRSTTAPAVLMQDGHLTLHQAAANQAPEALVRLLLDVRPEGAEEKDKVRGRRPVHHAPFAPNPHRVPCTVARATCMHTLPRSFAH